MQNITEVVWKRWEGLGTRGRLGRVGYEALIMFFDPQVTPAMLRNVAVTLLINNSNFLLKFFPFLRQLYFFYFIFAFLSSLFRILSFHSSSCRTSSASLIACPLFSNSFTFLSHFSSSLSSSLPELYALSRSDSSSSEASFPSYFLNSSSTSKISLSRESIAVSRDFFLLDSLKPMSREEFLLPSLWANNGKSNEKY